MQFNKIFSAAIAAGIALASVACQKVDEQPAEPEQVSAKTLTVTATIADIDGTKVGYAFTGTDADKAKSAIKQTWEEGDEIFGFDDKGGTFTFQVESVDGQTAKFKVDENEINEEAETLYAVYYPGKTAFDQNKKLAVDLTKNNGVLNGESTPKAPVIMCATAEIGNDGKVSFNFTNQTAVVGIYKMRIFDEGKPVGKETQISSVTLNGVYTKGKIQLESGKFGLVADSKEIGSITANELSLLTDDKGDINANITGEGSIEPYFSVIPSEYSSITVTAANGNGETYSTTGSIEGTLEAGKYYYIGKKIGVPVASITTDAGTTKYFTISDAFNAVQDGQTIKLENSCTVDKQSIVSSGSGTKTVTLDLNGKTLTQDGVTNRIGVGENGKLTISGTGTIKQAVAGASVFTVSQGTLNINGGTIEKGEDADNNTIVVSGGTLNVNGGTVTNVAKSTIYMSSGEVNIQNGEVTSGAANAVAIDDGTLTVSGGQISNTSKATVSISGGTATIKGGTMSSQSSNVLFLTGGNVEIKEKGTIKNAEDKVPAIQIDGTAEYDLAISGGAIIAEGSNAILIKSANGEINVTGGQFYCKTSAAVFAYSGTKPSLVVKGGIYNRNVNTMWIPAEEGYALENNDDQKYNHKVVKLPVTLKIGENAPVPYALIEEAINIANGEENKEQECEIKLLEESITVITKTDVTNTAGVTIDLNGNTLTQNNTARIQPSEDGTLIIKTTKDGGNVTQPTAGSYTFSFSSGTLEIQSGTIEKQAEATCSTVYMTGGTLIVSGGTISNPLKATIAISAGDATFTGGNISSENSNALSLTGGTVTIKENAALNSKEAKMSAINIGGSKEYNLKIEGGEIKSEQSNAIYINSTYKSSSEGDWDITITGGKLFAGKNNSTETEAALFSYGSSFKPKLVVTGGYFNKGVNASYWIPDTHTQDEKSGVEGYPYQVYPKTN